MQPQENMQLEPQIATETTRRLHHQLCLVQTDIRRCTAGFGPRVPTCRESPQYPRPILQAYWTLNAWSVWARKASTPTKSSHVGGRCCCTHPPHRLGCTPVSTPTHYQASAISSFSRRVTHRCRVSPGGVARVSSRAATRWCSPESTRRRPMGVDSF